MRDYLIKRKPEAVKRKNTPRSDFSYYVCNKPYAVLCQFSPEAGKLTLADVLKVEKDVYPVGRLDYDSEGLLLLTNDNAVKARLIDPTYSHEREYLVFTEGVPDKSELQNFATGLQLGTLKTKPAKIQIVDEPAWLGERVPPPRTYLTKAYSWLKIILTEGKNRQVRKMTAAIGHPTLRLVRTRILNLRIDGLKSGGYRQLTKKELSELKAQLSLQGNKH